METTVRPPCPLIRHLNPLHQAAMDMVEPLPITKEAHKYILTIVDYGAPISRVSATKLDDQ